MVVPGLDLSRVKWKDSIAQATTARPTLSYEDLGFTNVLRPGGGAVTTRCRRSMGWETPDQIDERLQGEFAMLRLAKSPPARDMTLPPLTVRFESEGARDPWGSRAKQRSSILTQFGAKPQKAAVECKAYINQLSKQNCPFATDRRFIGGEWLYKTSTLHQSEPLPDKRYLSVYEKRPLTRSRQPGPFSSFRSTRMLVAMIHQHMQDRSKATRTACRRVDPKHPLRALMKADIGRKGYLTHAELRECLDAIFVVVLDDEEVDRIIEAYPTAIPTHDGMPGFNYMAFVNKMNEMSQVHPLGGHAGSSWGYQQAPPTFHGKIR